MAKGDWSSNCLVRPLTFSITYDTNEPPLITNIETEYNVQTPSGNKYPFTREYVPAVVTPITQGITAIQAAVADILAYEGLNLG